MGAPSFPLLLALFGFCFGVIEQNNNSSCYSVQYQAEVLLVKECDHTAQAVIWLQAGSQGNVDTEGKTNLEELQAPILGASYSFHPSAMQ